jgi:hypothetical protein
MEPVNQIIDFSIENVYAPGSNIYEKILLSVKAAYLANGLPRPWTYYNFINQENFLAEATFIINNILERIWNNVPSAAIIAELTPIVIGRIGNIPLTPVGPNPFF